MHVFIIFGSQIVADHTYANENQLSCQCSQSCASWTRPCKGLVYRNPFPVTSLIIRGFSQQEWLSLKVTLSPVRCLLALNTSQTVCKALHWLRTWAIQTCTCDDPRHKHPFPMTSHFMLKFPGPTLSIGWLFSSVLSLSMSQFRVHWFLNIGMI